MSDYLYLAEPGEDAAVLERLMESYGTGLLRLCFLYLKDRALAEDAVQETMLRAWRHYGSFRGEAEEKTWLTSIAMNYCRSLMRSPWQTRRTSLEGADCLPCADSPQGDDTLRKAIQTLPCKYRAVILLYYYQELNTREVAQALGLSENTVSTRLRRARERLKPMLKEWYYDG